jgi:DNA-binding PadR family transcriptional regulator
VLTVGEGSLYPSLHRLEEHGWIESEWRLSEHNRRAKFYRLTARGRQRLRSEIATWGQFVDAVGKVLRTSEQPA